jgi:hypothetical protein
MVSPWGGGVKLSIRDNFIHFVTQSWKVGLPQMRNDGRFECSHVS